MKTFAIAFAAVTLAAGAASAQGAMTMTAKPGAKPAAAMSTSMKPATHTAMTTPTKTAPSTMTTSKTTVKGGPVTRTAASMECSKQADAQTLHGKARKKMMSACKTAAKT